MEEGACPLTYLLFFTFKFSKEQCSLLFRAVILL